MRKDTNRGPSVTEIKLRADLDRTKRELMKLKRANQATADGADAAAASAEAAEAAEAAAADDSHDLLEGAGLVADETLAAAIAGMRSQIAELTETRNRLSRLYFQQIEDTRRRATSVRATLAALGANRTETEVAALLERLANCIREHVPFRMVVARVRSGDRMEVAAFAGVPELARPVIAARTPAVREVEAWMDAPHKVGEAYHIPHFDAANASIPGWEPALDPREAHEWHAEDVLLVPVRDAAGDLAAVFSLDDPSDRAVPSSETLELLDLIARHAAVALENLRLREALSGNESPLRERRQRVRELRAALMSSVARADSAPAAGAAKAGEDGIEGLIGRMSEEESRHARLAARLDWLDRVEDALPVSGHTPADLGPVLEEAADTLRPLADRGRIALKLQIAATDTPVEAGRELLRELVLELGRNALKFTPSGGTVAFRLSGDASDVMLEVADSGSGIDPARLPHVFEGYRGLGAAGSGDREAGGIGLAICKSIVEWHGGRIFLESSGDRGTRVSVILPKRSRSRPQEPRSRKETPGTIIPLPVAESGRLEGSATEAPSAKAANERGR